MFIALVEAIFEQLLPHPECFALKDAQRTENKSLELFVLYKCAPAHDNKRERTDL